MVILKIILCKTMHKKINRSKTQDFMDKRNLCVWSLPISSWASLATWLHLDAPPENTKKINKYQLSNFELVLTHMILELGMLDTVGKLLVPFVTLCQKKFKKNLKLIAQGLPKIQSTILWLQGILGVNY